MTDDPARFPSRDRRTGPRVLVVEPSRGALSMIARRLADAGYRVIATESSEGAVAELRRQPIDLLLCELRSQPMDGVALTRLVRDDSVTADLPVLLVSGRGDRAGTLAALAAGADDVIAKPFDFDVLLARVARALARAKTIRALMDDKAALDARIIAKAIENGELKDRLRGLDRA